MWENFFGKTTDTRLEMRARSKEIDALKLLRFGTDVALYGEFIFHVNCGVM
jgi:hypothetical protein